MLRYNSSKILLSYCNFLTIPIFLFIFFLPQVAFSDDPKAREIMEKVDARDDGDNQVSDLEMILIDKNGKKRVRKLRSFSKDKGEDSLRLMFFLSPAEVKDTSFLTYDYDQTDRDDDQWFYLPDLKKTKRIASSDKSNSFMGSDFSYADMTKRDLNNYDYTLIKESKIGEVDVWMIKSIPRTKEIVDEYGYTKTIVFVRKDNFVVIRAANWLKGSKKIKYMDVKKLELIDGIWLGTEIHMFTNIGKKTLHKTILKNHNVRFNQALGEEFFSIRQMEKGL